jgi:ADP-ribosylglycohydrolase
MPEQPDMISGDTVLTVAAMNMILYMEFGNACSRFVKIYMILYARHNKANDGYCPERGYRGIFKIGQSDDLYLRHRYGNGAAMRVSPVEWA